MLNQKILAAVTFREVLKCSGCWLIHFANLLTCALRSSLLRSRFFGMSRNDIPKNGCEAKETSCDQVFFFSENIEERESIGDTPALLYYRAPPKKERLIAG